MSDLKNAIGGIVGTVAKTSKELVKTTKLNLDLNSEEGALKSIYVDIGKKVHEIYAYGGSLGKYFDEKYAEILKAEAKIAGIKSRICEVKGVKVCAKCDRKVDKSADFCPKCGGNRFNEYGFESAGAEDIREAEVIQERAPQAPKGKTCPLCGSDNNGENDKFCLACGRMIM